MSGVSMCRVVWVGGGVTWWLPAGGIRASQGTFSSWLRFFHHYTIEPSHEKTSNLGFDQVQHNLTCTVTEAG